MNKLESQLQKLLSRPRSAWGSLPPLKCADGFSMSVQAGVNIYSIPSSNDGPWTHVEVGYPSQIEPLLWEYAEQPGRWTDTVYPRVPVEVVAAVAEVHGGFAQDQ
jgi:hypothetical protein